MDEEFPAVPDPAAFPENEANHVLTPSQDIKSTPVPLTDGSYTIGNSILIVAVKLSNGSPTLLELQDVNFEAMTPISAPDMIDLLAADAEAKEQSENDSIPVDGADQAVERDGEYYLPMVKFEFEDVQFLVPRRRFMETVGHSTLILPSETDGIVAQDDVTAADFRGLMEFMYPLGPLRLSCNDWVSVLKLASKWHMVDYRKQALERLKCFYLLPEEKVILGRLCGVPDWYRRGCTALARGEAQLEIRHEATIGIDAMIKIARARDAAYGNNVVSYHKRTPILASFTRNIPSGFAIGDNSFPPTAGANIVEDICTARANRLPGWLQCCYERLINREESITLEELASLGLDTTVEIWKARLQLFEEYRRIIESTQPLPVDFASHIEAEFVDELEAAQLLQNILEPTPPPSSEELLQIQREDPSLEWHAEYVAEPSTGASRVSKKKKKKGK